MVALKVAKRMQKTQLNANTENTSKYLHKIIHPHTYRQFRVATKSACIFGMWEETRKNVPHRKAPAGQQV